MTEHSKKKKSMLGVAVALLPIAAMMLVNGTLYGGIALTVIAAVLFVLYDYLDDKVKGEPKLPEGVDQETFEDMAYAFEEYGPEVMEQLKEVIEQQSVDTEERNNERIRS